ncbi:MAG: hypothetical protein ACLGGV_03790 [Bacteroidia bacterium]
MYKKYFIAFGFGVFLYVLQLLAKFNHLLLPSWYVNYAADVVCLPLILSITLVLMRKIKRWHYFYLTNGMLATSLISVSLTFEAILPLYDKKYTADVWDVLFYFIGVIFFYFIQQYLKKEEKFKTSVNSLK